MIIAILYQILNKKLIENKLEKLIKILVLLY